MNEKEMSENLFLAIQASIIAGNAILQIYNENDFEVKLKEDKTPLTIADKTSHEVIEKHLTATNLPVLSEEGKSIPFEIRKHWNYFWLIDPLDGTKEFIKRNGEFTVNIALINKCVPEIGVIYVPVFKQLYFSEKHIGSFRVNDIDSIYEMQNIDELISKSTRLPESGLKNKFTVVASRSHLTAETEEYIQILKLQHDEIDFISKGSSLKICMVAEGFADIYPRFAPTMEWDTAAGQAIAVNAGFSFVHSDEKTPIVYNKESLLNPWFIVK